MWVRQSSPTGSSTRTSMSGPMARRPIHTRKGSRPHQACKTLGTASNALVPLGQLLTVRGVAAWYRSAETLLELMDRSGVEKALIVQPIVYLYDHSCRF